MNNDTLTLTIRLFDPKEKTDALKSASWAIIQVDRADLQMAAADFLAKYVATGLSQLTQLQLT